MPARTSQAAVCIVKVELQPSHLLITLTTNRNLDRTMYSARSDPPQHFTEREDALSAVAAFLDEFLR